MFYLDYYFLIGGRNNSMNNREKVIEKYVGYFLTTCKSVEKMGVKAANYNGLKNMIENLLQEILIAESPQGPEDVEPIKEKKILEIAIPDAQSDVTRLICIVMKKTNEIIRRVNKGI